MVKLIELSAPFSAQDLLIPNDGQYVYFSGYAVRRPKKKRSSSHSATSIYITYIKNNNCSLFSWISLSITGVDFLCFYYAPHDRLIVICVCNDELKGSPLEPTFFKKCWKNIGLTLPLGFCSPRPRGILDTSLVWSRVHKGSPVGSRAGREEVHTDHWLSAMKTISSY